MKKKITKVMTISLLFLMLIITAKAQIILEAEEAYYSSGKIDAQHAGFTGTGFVDTDNQIGEYIEWYFNAVDSITDSLKFRYALGKEEIRAMGIYVNNDLIDTIDFDNTTLFTNYVYKSIYAHVDSGLNRIKAVAINIGGAPNMDHLLIPVDTNLLPYYKISLSTDGNGVAESVPAHDSFRLGSIVSLQATGNPGFTFTNWSGDISDISNPLTMAVESDYNVMANFVQSLPAFPGAEGFGWKVTGGRGGAVIAVTNLNDNGVGSLRYAVEQSGARTVVFKVGGIIKLESDLKINSGDITIAGQTAPGDGITLAQYSLVVKADNVIIRYLRSRLGDVKLTESDAMWGRNQSNIILDHCTMSWSVDEAASFYDNTNFTMQYCLITESLYNSVHDKGQHGYGGIWGGHGATFHHNLLAHHVSRNPRFCGSRFTNRADLELVDFRNNVIFNWGGNSIYGGEGGRYNIVKNYYKSGPATKSSVRSRIIAPNADDGSNSQAAGVWGDFYVDGNFVTASSSVTANNWLGVDGSGDQAEIKSDTEFEVSEVTTQTAELAFEHVLAKVGACIPGRDVIDERIINEVISGKPTYGASYGSGTGIIDTQSDVGGWPVHESGVAPDDTDNDGMPDDWEDIRGLNSSDPDDRNGDDDADGYTNLEEYLNEMVEGYEYLLRPQSFEITSSAYPDVELTWNDITENETGFLLERKLGDGDFVQIAEIPSNTTSYTDNLEERGTYTYRIRAVNGTIYSLYSNEKKVDLTTVVENVFASVRGVKIYPNPFNENLSIKLTSDIDMFCDIILTDISGKIVAEFNSQFVHQGENEIKLTTSHLEQGYYNLTVKSLDGNLNEKILKY